MTIFQWAFTPLLFGMSALSLKRTLMRQGRRSLNLFWTLVWGSAGVMVVRPDLSHSLARLVGIGRGTDLVLYLAVIAGLFASLHYYHRHRALEVMVTELVRHVAIENFEVGGRPRID